MNSNLFFYRKEINLYSHLEEYYFYVLISFFSVSKSKLKAFSIVLVVDNVGSPLFEKVNDDITTSWIAIELGGLGGYSIPPVLGSISLFNPATAC